MIRPYKPADKKLLLKIFKLNTPKYFDKNEVSDFEKYLEHKGDSYLTVEVNSEIVGGAGYYVNEVDKSGRITWIFFDPKCAGQGLGRQVVEYCLSMLSVHTSVEKFVVTTSQFGFGFFEKFGYRVSRIVKDYWGEGLDLYEMEMDNKRTNAVK